MTSWAKHTSSLLWTKERLRLSGLSAVTILVTIFYTSFINIYQHLSIFYIILWHSFVTNTANKTIHQIHSKTMFQIWSKSCPYFAQFMHHIFPIFFPNIDMVQFCPFYDQFMVHILPIICPTTYVSHIWTKIWPIYGPKFAQILPHLFCGTNRSKLWSRFGPCFGPILPIIWP